MDPSTMQALIAHYVQRDQFTYADIAQLLQFFAGKMVPGFDRDDDVKAILSDAYLKITQLQAPTP